ncbi:MAG TPA: hypothetical protein VNW97_03520 [Candidatus Saccharimonadales bacterium]|nr:hypothetical protein [Candidatus Saccharimonadales bacterium]
MKRLFATFAALVIALAFSPVASAQRGHGGGKPATTGLEHAETKANFHGERGIENAESKHDKHKDDRDRDNDRDKKKHKKHHKKHRS